MKLNIEKMSLAELTELNAKVTAELPKARAREVAAARTEIEKSLATRGMKLGDVFDAKPSKPRGRPAKSSAPKWRHPETGATWGGRGRRPKNFDEATWQKAA